jgi:uncharacterized protein (DUF885 family)
MDRRTFVQRATITAAGFGILRNVEACAPARPSLPPEPVPIPGTFAEIRDKFFAYYLQHDPVTSTYLGGDGYSPELADSNGRLRDYRQASLDAEVSFYKSLRASLLRLLPPIPATVDTTTRTVVAAPTVVPQVLTPIELVDHRVMSSQIAFLIHQIGELRYHQRAVDTYVAEPFRGVDWQIQQMTEIPGGSLGTQAEWQLVVTRAQSIPAYLEVAKTNLLAGKQAGNIPDKRMVQRDGINGSRANAEYFRKTLPELVTGYVSKQAFAQPTMALVTATGMAAATAWDQFADFLAANFDVNEAVDRFASGEREYEWRVHTLLGDPRSAAELYDYGAQQVALYTARIVEVARDFANEAKLGLPFNTDAEKYAGVRRVMEFLSKDSPRDDTQLLRWYREAGVRAVTYGREQGLFDIPQSYRLDVFPTPPVLRSTIDAAYYPAPPFKKTGVGRFYLTPTGNSPAALKENNFSSVADTAVHEGFPGHDWHYKYMNAHTDAISNIRWLTPGAVEDSSSMWADSMAAEGWALYAEELMSEPTPNRPYGFYSRGEYLYELQGQLLRAVRIVVDVGIHTGRMTFDQAIDYFTEHVSFVPNARINAAANPTARAITDGATRAIYRYSKWPTQAITYNLGKNAIISLRDECKTREGSTFSKKKFHERFMGMGTIPAGYFRESFLSQCGAAPAPGNP